MLAGESTSAEWANVTEAQRQWIEVDRYLNVTLYHCFDLVCRGYANASLDYREHALTRASGADAETLIGTTRLAQMGRALLGQPVEILPIPDDRTEPGTVMQYVMGSIQAAIEQDEVGAPFEVATEAFDRLAIPLREFSIGFRIYFAYQALGRLSQARHAAPEQRAAALTRAEVAVRQLGRAANDPWLKAYHQVLRADLWQQRGRHDRALKLLGRTEEMLLRLDAPLVRYEAARIGARALRGLGEEALAEQQARAALMLASQHGWVRRARWLRDEFGIADATTRQTTGYTQRSETHGDRYRRRLEALQQVNAAAASVLDPQQLARVALDETLRILGAERAVLFLTADDGTLQPSVGRTGTGELAEVTDYAASLVEQVGASRKPLVVTGTEEGAAHGSQSAIVHGLRSIMIAPLELDGRLLGVVYLDSRVAKGVFTDEDVDILSAITNHVAVSLETARAAQLEVAVHAARQQRDIAETLREAMTELAATLDPDQVLHRLRDIATRALGADQVCVLHEDQGQLTVASTLDPDLAGADSRELLTLTTARAGGADTVAPALTALLGEARCWLATPLVTHGHGNGVLLAASTTAAEFSPAQVDTASALASQAATAYDTARLFAQTRYLATTDGLTGAYNRRHFTELATGQLKVAQRNNRHLAALMIDIDHFKKINDTHGHGTGDEVIRAVASALHGSVREPDILGRYGGEEFAMVMSEMWGNPMEVAERVRAAVAATVVAGPTGPVRATVSIGVAELKPGDQLDTLLARADAALYRAKEAGRDRVKMG
jgi:diguanylate cyclase (GGDEF)-like protein